MQKLTEWFERTDAMRPIGAILLTFLFWAMVAGCVAVAMPPIPAPYADVPPEPQPQELSCGLSGVAGATFTLTCAEPTATPTATPEPTATIAPAFHYFWCEGDPRCSSGQFRVYWDRPLSLLRCALPTGAKVDVIAYGLSGRTPEESEELAWVVTGADAGNGNACEGWTPVKFLKAAE